MIEGDIAEENNKGGRPLKFQAVSDLIQKIEAYFGSCDPHLATRKIFQDKADGSKYITEEEYFTEQRPYTVNGLAYALGTSRETLTDYESGKYDEKAEDFDKTGLRFSDAIKAAKRRVAIDIEERLLSGKTPPAAGIFWLKNNDGWKDRQEVDHSTLGKPMQPQIVSEIKSRHAEAEAETESGN